MSYQYRGAQPIATEPEVQAEVPSSAAAPIPASGSKTGLLPCGTNAAYGRHLNKGEKPCPACTQAHAEYTASRREYERQRAARKKLAAEAQLAYDEAMLAHPENAIDSHRRRKELTREVELAAAHARAESGTPMAEAA